MAQSTRGPTLAVQPGSEPSLAEGFHFLLQGEFGVRYTVDKSDDALTWSPWAAVTNSFGVLQVNDATATNQTSRMYRVRLAP